MLYYLGDYGLGDKYESIYAFDLRNGKVCCYESKAKPNNDAWQQFYWLN